MAKKNTDNPYIKGRAGKIVEDQDKPGAPKINLLSIPVGVDEKPLENLS